MNTTEIEYSGQIKSFEELFDLAKKQFVHYEQLEGIENWDDYDFSIDCAEDQMKFKDMLQIRFIEELTEASVSLPEPEEHFWEEIGDALNFFLSAYAMLGVDFNSLPSPSKYLNKGKGSGKIRPESLSEFCLFAYPIIEKVGWLCNLLKNRPWAQSNYLVSLQDFDERLLALWKTFWMYLGDFNLSDEDVFEMFYRKYKVNEFRISTGY